MYNTVPIKSMTLDSSQISWFHNVYQLPSCVCISISSLISESWWLVIDLQVNQKRVPRSIRPYFPAPRLVAHPGRDWDISLRVIQVKDVHCAKGLRTSRIFSWTVNDLENKCLLIERYRYFFFVSVSNTFKSILKPCLHLFSVNFIKQAMSLFEKKGKNRMAKYLWRL